MVIDHDVGPYRVFEDVGLDEALQRINANKSQMIFTIDENGELTGVMTDGDFRRWAVTQAKIDLSQPVSNVASKNIVVGSIDAPSSQWADYFSDAVRLIPLVDQRGHLVAIGRPNHTEMRIGDFVIGDDAPVFIIAEIGNNHNGSESRARRLVDEAVAAGADAVKFQMRQLNSMYRNGGDPRDPEEDLGAQYTLDLLHRFSLDNDSLLALFDYCRESGIEPICTPWDTKSAAILGSYGVNAYKVASADLTNHDLLRVLARTNKPLLVSTGMSTEEEIKESIAVLAGQNAPYVLLHCNSTYPVPNKDVNLAYLGRLRNLGDCIVGYSGHDRGINMAIGAVALGAKVIEKHFTLDKTLEGSDHKISLLPAEFREMVDAIRQVEEGIGDAKPRQVTQGERMNREILGKSLIAKRTIDAKEIITTDMLDVKSPGRGLQPNLKPTIVGRRAVRTIDEGNFIFLHDLEENCLAARSYEMALRWGIPVRYHDFSRLVSLSNPDLVEFHLSYRDLELDFRPYLQRPFDLDLVVHCPELFRGDHILDLCSLDSKHRERSIGELQRVLDLTRELADWFRMPDRAQVVTNVGGFSEEGHLSKEEMRTRRELFLVSLDELDTHGVELLPQTMPPFPWHFGGQRFHNLFVDPHDIADICQQRDLRVCLDISHAKLASNHFGWSLSEYVACVAPYVAHLHIADARNVDSEGLQILEGEVDFAALAADLKMLTPSASFIPEIWQGHVNDGEGFWVALDRLERWFGGTRLKASRPTHLKVVNE